MIWNNIRAEIDQRKADVDYFPPNRYLPPIHLLINDLICLCKTDHTLYVNPFGGHSSICYNNLRLKLALALEFRWCVDLYPLTGKEILYLSEKTLT